MKKNNARTGGPSTVSIANLQKIASRLPPKTVVIAGGDRIFPAANQRRFWQGLDTLSVDSGHYPFHLWESWEELLAFADASRTS